jgi:hypothetical protein
VRVRISKNHCLDCRTVPVEYPRVVCVYCELRARADDHDRIIRAPVLDISSRIAHGPHRAPPPAAPEPPQAGRPLLTLKYRRSVGGGVL